MTTRIQRHIYKLINTRRKDKRVIATFLLLAAVVTLGVVSVLRRSGIAVTHTEQVLDCHYSGAAAHTHDASCFDSNGNLVCPLPERPLHVHDDSCYTEVRTLTCGLEEGEGHTHTDECYTVTRELTCGLEELTEEHVHGPGCFREVTVNNSDGQPVDDASTDVANTDDAPVMVDGQVEDGGDNPQDDRPAQTFTHEFKDADDNLLLRVTVDAPEGALPARTTMRAAWIDPQDVDEDMVQEAMDSRQTEGKLLELQAVDLTFLDASGAEIEPATDVTVTFASALVNKDDQAMLLHLEDEDEAKARAELEGSTKSDPQGQPVDELSDAELAKRQMTLADDELAFEASQFSTYLIALTSLQHTMRAEGQTVNIVVDAPAEAGIPQEATLSVTEIAEGAEGYDGYLGQVEQVVPQDSIQLARFFDITIRDAEGNELQPAEPVQVSISVSDAPADANAEAQVVHFGDSMEMVDAQESEGTSNFDATGFSVYGVVYTVDFAYDGYMVSIPGNASVLLSTLASELGLPDHGDIPFAAQDVKDISFTNDSLVRVTKVGEDTTVDGLLAWFDNNGVETWLAQDVVVRTEGMSDDEVLAAAEAVEQVPDEAPVMAGDWVLTGLQAFSSNESLVITMGDGYRYLVEVTDLDTNSDGKKPATVQGVDTASEGITITMFDYGPEKLDNVNNTYKSTDNSGINKGHDLKFYSYGTEGSTINNFTGGAYAMQGVVRSTLDANGYPVTSTNSNGGNGESLAYLFNPDALGNGATVTSTNANYLFQRDDNDNLYYDSDKNYAYLNGDNFTLYGDTYLEEGADYANPFRIGFYPYNDYDNRYRCIHGNNFNWGCAGSKDRRVRDQVGHYNHHFGMKVEGAFYMTDDKKTPNNQDMIFRFSGDDDMWVFIDGVLVLDIGGIHNPVDGQINFTTGQVTVSAAKTAKGGANYALGTNTTIAKAFEKAGKTWDDSPLSQHDIKIFYMERGGMYSNLAITMNLPTFPDFKHAIMKKIDADSSAALAGAQFELYSDVACTKPIKQDGSNDPIIVTSESVATTKTIKKDSKGGTQSVSLSVGDVLVADLIPGQTYYLKEIAAPEGYKLDNRVFKIVAPANNDDQNDEAKVYLVNTDGTETLLSTPPQITNKKDVYGSLIFTKVEKGTTTGVQGATFTLYADADCTQVAKAKNGSDLVATSGSGGTVSFGSQNIPAGTTYYMKETGTPEGYFPSTDVYRVVLDASGTATIYKGEGAVTSIDNEPKQQKTSISVEKRWSDGSANHTGDTVTVQLLETVEETGKTGGSINVTVAVNKWYEDGDESKDATTPTSGSITYQLQKSTDGTNWTNVGSSVTLDASSWSNTHLNLAEMENDQHIKYRVAELGKDGTVVKTVDINGSNEVCEDNGTINLKAGIKASGGNDSPTATVTIKDSGVISSNNSNWEVKPADKAQWYRKDGDQYISIDQNAHWWSDSQSLSNTTPDGKITLSNIEKRKNGYSNLYLGFIPNLQVVKDNIIYVKSNPNIISYNNYGTTIYLIPLNQDNITIEFSSTPFPAGTNSTSPTAFAKLMRRAMQVRLTDGNVVATGDYYTEIPAEAAPVTQSGITNKVTLNQNSNGQWAYTWSGLTDSESVTKNGYTFTRKHHYYVKEIEVNLADGTDEDFVVSNYTTEDGKVIITNTVPPKTGLEVTKEWYEQDGKTPASNHSNITFEVHRVYKNAENETIDTVYGEPQTISYDNSAGKYGTAKVENLPTKINDNGVVRDVSYYVVETSPASSNDLTTYYRAADGTQYADPADAAGKGNETIVNVNSSKEITVTKNWFYQKGDQVTEATVPPETDVYFKLKKVNKETGAAEGYFTANTTGTPTSSLSEAPQGYTVSSSSSNGTIYHLICTSTTTTKPSEIDPTKTISTTTWSWNTLTFNDLPADHEYYLVETDSSGRELMSDSTGTKIAYVDDHDKEVGASSPIDPSIPGNYTIKNTEHRTSLYAQKVWQGANKDNLAGNESVWFSLMRVETDGSGGYDWTTLEETPGVGRFALKESSGWGKYFDNIEVAPAERHSSDKYKYWQYFIVELGLLDEGTKDNPDADKTYKLIDNLYVEYQSKGSGTNAADGSIATGRDEFKPYGQGVASSANTEVTHRSMTVGQWIDALKANQGAAGAALLDGEDGIVRLNTWGSKYDGTGTLGCFNSSEQFLEKPLDITKTWKDANGKELTSEERSIINADGDDRYSVEIQLMQHATVTDAYSNGDYRNKTYDAAYGSTFMVNPGEVVMQSDLFEVNKKGTGLWAFEIPAANSNGEKQLPSIGAFRIPNSDETVVAAFTYYVSEYRVYDASGNDVTTQWSAACVVDAADSTYGITLENRKTTDLTLHKKWTDVSASSRSWVDDNVQAVLYKVYRKQTGSSEDPTDITELIRAFPAGYGLASAKTYETELNDVFEDFVRVDKPASGWGITDSGSAEAKTVIQNLNALVRDFGPVNDRDALDGWPTYTYWAEECGYVDADGAYQPISKLLHGSAETYPKYYAKTDDGATDPWSATATTTATEAALVLGANGTSHIGTANTVRGTDLKLIKTDAVTGDKLKGAEFTLLKIDSQSEAVRFAFDANNGTSDVTVTDGKIVISNENGYTVKNLMPGTYQLTETKAPGGYIVQSSDPITFVVRESGTIVAQGTAENATTLPTGANFEFVQQASSASVTSVTYNLTVKNTPGQPLPSAGGMGTLPLYLLGVALVMAAGAHLLRQRTTESR